MPQRRNYHLMFREGSTALYYTFPGSQAHFVVYDSDGTGLRQRPSPALVWCVEALAQARQSLLAYKTAERLEDIDTTARQHERIANKLQSRAGYRFSSHTQTWIYERVPRP